MTAIIPSCTVGEVAKRAQISGEVVAGSDASTRVFSRQGGAFTVESACLGGDVVKSRGMYSTSEKRIVARQTIKGMSPSLPLYMYLRHGCM